MALAFAADVQVDHDGYVRWSFHSHPGAEAAGFPLLSRGGYVGGVSSDDGSGVRQADLLVALESVATVMLTASRTLTATRPLLTAAGDPIDDGSLA